MALSKMVYNLTSNQKEILKLLVGEIGKGTLEEEFTVIFTFGGSDILGYDGNPPQITEGALVALASNDLIIIRYLSETSIRVTLKQSAYTAVDSEFAVAGPLPHQAQVSMNGAVINVQGGEVNIANKIDSHDVTITSALPEMDNLFAHLLEMAASLKEETDKTDAESAINALRSGAAKGDKALDNKVTKWLNFLIDTAPDIGDVAIASFINPALGSGMVFKKVAERVRSKTKAD